MRLLSNCFLDRKSFGTAIALSKSCGEHEGLSDYLVHDRRMIESSLGEIE
jgi:hypothetical protein